MKPVPDKQINTNDNSDSHSHKDTDKPPIPNNSGNRSNSKDTLTFHVVEQPKVDPPKVDPKPAPLVPQAPVIITSAETVPVGQSITFTDGNAVNGAATNWSFGDGSKGADRQASPMQHIFAAAGTYKITAVRDGKPNLRQEKVITVLLPAPDIAAPATAAVGVPVTVEDKAAGPGIKTSWKFGETGKVDALGPKATYAYQKASNYTITATHEGNPPVTKDFTITIAHPHVKDETILADLKALMQNDTKRFGELNGRLKSYVCGNDAGVSVNINGGAKTRTFYNYCRDIIVKPREITSLTATRGADECITGINIQEQN